jgi:hypothetical protein
MSYMGIIFLAASALIAIVNLCSTIETWLRRRRGVSVKYSNVLLASFACGCLAWYKARNTIGLWAFLPALLDPGTWICFPVAFRWWARRSEQADRRRRLKRR